MNRRFLLGLLAAVGAASSGCQTWYGGMTLPSPHYLKHPPQYFPQDPAFPLQRELDSMSDPEGGLRSGKAVGAPIAAPAATGPVGAPATPAVTQGR